MQIQRYSHIRAVAVAAALATIALTGVAFWLSYEHLAEVAKGNGLPGVRGWAWPATVDLFIVIGELLVLRASLQGETDWFAFFITGTGSAGSIALNVAGVGSDASRLEYTVAAVPPVAALLAFAALMRQIHGALKRREEMPPMPPLPPSSMPLPEAHHTLDAELVEFLQHQEDREFELEEPHAWPLGPDLEPAPVAENPQVTSLEGTLQEEPVALEAEPLNQETLVEKLVAGGEPLPGRSTVAKVYGVTEWDARQALVEAKRRLQENLQPLQMNKGV